MDQNKKPLLLAGGVWLKETPRAGKHFSGKIGTLPEGAEIKTGTRFWVFKNKKKRHENSPDYLLMVEDTREDSGPGFGDPPPDDGSWAPF